MLFGWASLVWASPACTATTNSSVLDVGPLGFPSGCLTANNHVRVPISSRNLCRQCLSQNWHVLEESFAPPQTSLVRYSFVMAHQYQDGIQPFPWKRPWGDIEEIHDEGPTKRLQLELSHQDAEVVDFDMESVIDTVDGPASTNSGLEEGRIICYGSVSPSFVPYL